MVKGGTKEERGASGDVGREAWELLSSLVYPPPFLNVARKLDLRPASFAALRALDQPRTMSELARFLHCDNSNVTGIVDNLEEKNLAVRLPLEADRRIKLVELSVKGEKLLKRVNLELARAPDWVQALSATDRRTLRDVLQRAVDARTPGP